MSQLVGGRRRQTRKAHRAAPSLGRATRRRTYKYKPCCSPSKWDLSGSRRPTSSNPQTPPDGGRTQRFGLIRSWPGTIRRVQSRDGSSARGRPNLGGVAPTRFQPPPPSDASSLFPSLVLFQRAIATQSQPRLFGVGRHHDSSFHVAAPTCPGTPTVLLFVWDVPTTDGRGGAALGREIITIQAGQCGNNSKFFSFFVLFICSFFWFFLFFLFLVPPRMVCFFGRRPRWETDPRHQSAASFGSSSAKSTASARMATWRSLRPRAATARMSSTTRATTRATSPGPF